MDLISAVIGVFGRSEFPTISKVAGATPIKGMLRRFRYSRCEMKQARLTVLPPANVRNGWKADIRSSMLSR